MVYLKFQTTNTVMLYKRSSTKMYCLILVGSIQFARTGELSDDSEPRRGRVHWSGEVQVSRDADPPEEATAEFGSESWACWWRETDSSLCVTAEVVW